MPSSMKANIQAIAGERGLTVAGLAQRLKTTPSQFRETLAKEKVPEAFIKRLAHELLVPDYALFMDKPPHVGGLVDFRERKPSIGGFTRDTAKAIKSARSIRSAISDIGYDVSGQRLSDLVDGADIDKAASQLRAYIAIDWAEQAAMKDARVFYKALRQRAESLQLFITQASFDDGAGFCLSEDSGVDVITINTKLQSPGRRLFTLGYEFYHCIINRSGLSDPEVTNNNVEKKCNKFSAEFLAPKDFVRFAAKRFINNKSLDTSELRRFSSCVKISQYASVIRLHELGFYTDEAVSKWHRIISNSHPDVPPKRKGGQPTDQWKVKLARYGFKFAHVFGAAVEKGDLDNIDVFRIAQLKPEYQGAYFANAATATAQDAEDEE
ncbi:ImmA/IrrE family metallo-endopeptidase [Beijerinckia sp. L45]|uniref:ImmA/IrrE family metallo-endopeptidase n=1 Tax=Beijerinckia sp. L45 TaxID=1641855 RepID=UPI00131E8C0E|nr:ImmA/IrrE family metallo-endopeptidase [Beijerinckia sp. L45]